MEVHVRLLHRLPCRFSEHLRLKHTYCHGELCGRPWLDSGAGLRDGIFNLKVAVFIHWQKTNLETQYMSTRNKTKIQTRKGDLNWEFMTWHDIT